MEKTPNNKDLVLPIIEDLLESIHKTDRRLQLLKTIDEPSAARLRSFLISVLILPLNDLEKIALLTPKPTENGDDLSSAK
jgi:hypothetical protein